MGWARLDHLRRIGGAILCAPGAGSWVNPKPQIREIVESVQTLHTRRENTT